MMDDWTPIIVLSLVAAVIGLQLLWRHKALQSKGQSTAALKQAIPQLDEQAPGLVFCYSPSCAPCRNMLPAIDELAADHPNIHKLDISEHMALAREIGIRATPTTLLTGKGSISRVILGAKSPSSLRKLLDSPLSGQ